MLLILCKCLEAHQLISAWRVSIGLDLELLKRPLKLT